MVFKIYFRFCTSAGPKSRVPFGKVGFEIAIIKGEDNRD